MTTTQEISTICRHYIACALWSSMDERDESGGEPLDANLGDVGDKLTDLTKPYGSVDLSVGDDGLIHA